MRNETLRFWPPRRDTSATWNGLRSPGKLRAATEGGPTDVTARYERGGAAGRSIPAARSPDRAHQPKPGRTNNTNAEGVGFEPTRSLHAIQRRRTARYPWTLLVAFSALSVAFNVLHAPPTAIARLVAAVPPLTLVLSFELLMRQLRDWRPAAAQTPVARGSRTSEAKSQTEQLETTDVLTGGRSILQRAREIQEQHRDDDVKLTGKTLGQILGVSDGYARRLLREIGATQTAGTAAEPVGN